MEDNSNQADDNRQSEPHQVQRSTIRFQEAWETISTFAGRPSVRTAAKLTAALILLGLSALGYRHYFQVDRGE